jgi:hypothetical protein
LSIEDFSIAFSFFELYQLQQHRQLTGILSDLADWSFKSASDNLDAGTLSFIDSIKFLKALRRSKKGSSTTWNDTFFNRGTRSVKGIINTVTLFFHFNFSSATNAE